MDDMTQAARIRHYLETGEADADPRAWPGANFLDQAHTQHVALRSALIAEVRRRAEGAVPPTLPPGLDLAAFARGRVAPMVDGLFPAPERQPVVRLLERAVVFLTPETIEEVLTAQRWPHTAWQLANVYLGSLGRPGLHGRPVGVVGLSEETSCYLALTYFTEPDPFADFLVHEAAHVFHNWKRENVGLPHTRTREWLLEIDFRQRETFAYACEAYSRILTLGATRRDRARLLEEFAATPPSCDEKVKDAELLDILSEAVGARNGWARIRARCGPNRPLRRRPRVSAREAAPDTPQPLPGDARDGSIC
jgi:hypothetical protein